MDKRFNDLPGFDDLGTVQPVPHISSTAQLANQSADEAAAHATQQFTRLKMSWCPCCGALLDPKDLNCPKCGCHIKEAPVERRQRNLQLPEIGGAPAAHEPTAFYQAELDSALPDSDHTTSAANRYDRMPRMRVFIFAAVFAVLVFGGGVLLLAHPWNPESTNPRSQQPVDTSTAGFPGARGTLSGQDKSIDLSGTVATDSGEAMSTPQKLDDIYKNLGICKDELSRLLNELTSIGLRGTTQERLVNLEAAHNLQNGLTRISQQLDEIRTVHEDAHYLEPKGHLVDATSALKDRVEAVVKAWDRSSKSTRASNDDDKILGFIRDTESENPDSALMKFTQSYEAYKLQNTQS